MRRLRVTASMRKRLADARGAGRGGSALRGGVMVIPPMMSVAEWEAHSLPAQERLIADARDSIAVTVDTSPDPMDVSHRYKPDPARPRKPEANGG